MKKLALTIAIVFTIGLSANAQFSMLGKSYDEVIRKDPAGTTPLIVQEHGLETDEGADAPLGSGVAMLLGLGAAYVVAKKRKEK